MHCHELAPRLGPGDSCLIPAGRPRGRGAKASRQVSEVAGVIRISDDSSTESDAGLDSDFHSSPESLADDDVVIVDAIGLPADDRGEAHDPELPYFTDGGHRLREGVSGSADLSGSSLATVQTTTSPARVPQAGGDPICPLEPRAKSHCEWGYG